MTSIRAWDGRKGRLAIMIDCADRMVLAWRFAPRITADDLAEMLREAVFQRFGTLRIRAQRIEFLSTNVPEYTSHRFRPFVRAMGLIPCYTPPPQPGIEWLAGGVLRQLQAGLCLSACLEMVEDVARQLLSWIEHDNQQAPHSALAMQSPVEFYAQGIVNTKQRPVQN